MDASESNQLMKHYDEDEEEIQIKIGGRDKEEQLPAAQEISGN